jgi:hypothetical protein
MGLLHSRLAKANRCCIAILSAFVVPNCTPACRLPDLGLEMLSRLAAAIQGQVSVAIGVTTVECSLKIQGPKTKRLRDARRCGMRYKSEGMSGV